MTKKNKIRIGYCVAYGWWILAIIYASRINLDLTVAFMWILAGRSLIGDVKRFEEKYAQTPDKTIRRRASKDHS